MKCLIVLLFLSSSLFAGVECLHTNEKEGISWIDEKEEAFFISDFEFRSSHFVPPFLGCLRFLGESKNPKKPLFLPLFSMKDLPMWRIKNPSGSSYYQNCLSSSVCEISFPYNILNLWHYGLPILKKSASKSHWPNTCTERSHDKKSLGLSQARLSQAPSEIWELPKTSLGKELFENIDSVSEGSVIVSTMTLSETMVKRLSRVAESRPKLNILLIFSFNISSMRKEFGKIMSHARDNFLILPMFTDPAAPKDYHIKGASLVGKTRDLFLFQSGNFREYDDVTMSDLGFTFQDGLGQKFEKLIRGQISDKCQRRKYSHCTFETRFGHRPDVMQKIESSWDKACKDWSRPFNPSANQELLVSGQFDLRSQVSRMIEGAQTEIKMMAHLVFDKDLMKKLEGALKRGVSVSLLQGQANRRDFPIPFAMRFSPAESEAHSKLIIVDKKIAIISTANWTPSGLENPMELSFVIDNQKALKDITEHFDRMWALSAP